MSEKIRQGSLYLAAIICLLLVSAVCPSLVYSQGNPYNYLEGYREYLAGEKFNYHSARPDVGDAMLVRSLESELFIEWETAPVPYTSGESATFVIMAAINVQEEDQHSWDISINGVNRFVVTTPGFRSLDVIDWGGENGFSLKFKPHMVDRYGDLHGYLYMTVPTASVAPGKPLRIRATGESSGSRSFFIVYMYAATEELNIVPEQAVRRDGDRLYQEVKVEYTWLGDPADAVINAGGMETPAKLAFGYNSIRAAIPAVESSREFPVTISSGGKILGSEKFILHPVTPRTIYLLHHSHVDIGYTHVQDEVERIQWEHLENAISYGDASSSNPPEARFRWNSEVMWAVQSYLDNKPEEKREALLEAIRKGSIELNGLYANVLTELCNTEELIRLTSDARRFTSSTGIEIKSAMITDIPGWSWGLVPVLAGSGIRYLSLGTNHGHRIGATQEVWADKPFWWISPSGEERVLCWIHRNGYSMFHTGLGAEKMSVESVSDRIFSYLNQVEESGYPYHMVPVRYSIGADNGPPDPDLAELVMEWNSMFDTPQLRISTVSETFSLFEEKYGDMIPGFSGAFTGYWEDGAASSAKMTSLNRQAAATMNVASSLATIMAPGNGIDRQADRVWNRVILYDEHTWGSWNSISDPENEFTLSQWAVKSQFARDAALMAHRLKDSIAGVDPQWRSTEAVSEEAQGVEVINTHPWSVSSIVEIPPTWRPKGFEVVDAEGKKVDSEVTASGHLLFRAERLPPMGSSIYRFRGKKVAEKSQPEKGSVIENDMFRLEINKHDGSIKTLFSKSLGRNIAGEYRGGGLNSYRYVSGRSPERVSGATDAKSRIIENGEMVKVLEVQTGGEGVNSISIYYTIVKGVDRVYITTVTDKKLVYKQEGVHLAFPFNIPGGRITIDLAMGAYSPGTGQLPGSNMNYYTAERWVDVSNNDYGVTMVTLDAPLLETGDITTDATAYGWLREPLDSQTIISYLMNNYWETNYLAGQEGEISFRYIIAPHGKFSAADAERLASSEAERPVVVPGKKHGKARESLFTVKPGPVVIASVVPVERGYILRLLNAGDSEAELNIEWGIEADSISFCDFDGKPVAEFVQGSTIPAWGFRNLRVNLK